MTDSGLRWQGTVNVAGFAKPVLLIGREHMNRSVQDDIVAVEVFPESEWKAPGDEVIDQEGNPTLIISKNMLLCSCLF